MSSIRLVVSGLANGCVYGLIALGFVPIYKATEAVNFAQGDFMMLGAVVTLGLTGVAVGLPFWAAVPVAVPIMGAFGYLLDAAIVRRMFGQQGGVGVESSTQVRMLVPCAAGKFEEDGERSAHRRFNLGVPVRVPEATRRDC